MAATGAARTSPARRAQISKAAPSIRPASRGESPVYMPLDLTVVLTAAITGTAGYGGARLQGKAARDQSRAQVAQATADRDLTALEKRQAAYHDLLDAVRGLHLLVYGEPPPTTETFATWNSGYQHLLNGVGLVGVPAVRDAATAFDGVLRTLGDNVPDGPSGFAQGLQHGYGAIESELTECFRVMMDAMSADVAPEGSR